MPPPYVLPLTEALRFVGFGWVVSFCPLSYVVSGRVSEMHKHVGMRKEMPTYLCSLFI